MIEPFLILVLILAGAYWWQAAALKEFAYETVRRHCRAQEVQLLDDCIALTRVTLCREDGKLNLSRTYQFEFSSTGDDRYGGSIRLIGRRIVSIEMAPYRIVSSDGNDAMLLKSQRDERRWS